MGEVFETSDPDVAEQVLRDAYGGNIRITADGQAAGLRLESARLTPSVQLDNIRFAMNFALAGAPLGVVTICRVRSGRVSYHSRGSERAYGPDDVFFPIQPDHSYTARCEQTEFEAAIIDPALLSQIAGTRPGRTQQPLRFTSYEALPPQAALRWNSAYAYARDSVLARPEAAAQPLLVSSTARLLAAVALAVFPNNALTDPTIEDRHDAHPATLRRAVAFIDEHAHEDISVADIAAACFVTVRAVQLAFRRHLDTTPLEYLRRVRLDHAHRELLAASPAQTTVTAVSFRWGFPSGSRFAAYYRETYGVTPSQTLHRR
jgi:AraC-like DNA-binding protein